MAKSICTNFASEYAEMLEECGNFKRLYGEFRSDRSMKRAVVEKKKQLENLFMRLHFAKILQLLKWNK